MLRFFMRIKDSAFTHAHTAIGITQCADKSVRIERIIVGHDHIVIIDIDPADTCNSHAGIFEGICICRGQTGCFK